MSKKIDARIPHTVGKGLLREYPAIESPWGHLTSFHDAVHYVSRYNAVFSSAVMAAYRILLPDYAERTTYLCQEVYDRVCKMYSNPAVPEMQCNRLNVHPFCRGNFVGGLYGDEGDDSLLMTGRVNDFGTYRVEKELDICDWDIIGSELCRATTLSLQGYADNMATANRKGPRLEYNMVEAKGCGDRHCRVVAECRKRYPMPEKPIYQSMGPIATGEQIKFTPEEDCVKEPMFFRDDTDYEYSSGTNNVNNYMGAVRNTQCCAASYYLLPTIEYLIGEGVLDKKFVDHVLKCCLESAGKSLCGDPYAKAGIRQWLGVPNEIGDDDGRVMGGYLEMYLQSMSTSYEIEAFNKDEVIYVIDRKQLCMFRPSIIDCLLYYWSGMTRTLVNAQWFLWEEDSPEGKLRIKIAKKIDKYC